MSRQRPQTQPQTNQYCSPDRGGLYSPVRPSRQISRRTSTCLKLVNHRAGPGRSGGEPHIDLRTGHTSLTAFERLLRDAASDLSGHSGVSVSIPYSTRVQFTVLVLVGMFPQESIRVEQVVDEFEHDIRGDVESPFRQTKSA